MSLHLPPCLLSLSSILRLLLFFHNSCAALEDAFEHIMDTDAITPQNYGSLLLSGSFSDTGSFLSEVASDPAITIGASMSALSVLLCG